MRRRGFLTALGAVALATPRRARAHPYHTSFAEMHLRPGRAEVSMRWSPEDLEQVLGKAAGHSVSLERTASATLDALLVAYLREHFVLRTSNGEARPLSWVGREVRPRHVWSYFELGLGVSLRGATLRDSVLFEVAPAAVNRVWVVRGDAEATLVFRHDRTELPLRPTAP